MGRIGLPRSEWAEAALVLLITYVAFAIRQPFVQLIPSFTDEVEDIYRSLITARGQIFPLTDTSTYIGSLGNWVVAGAFLVSGFDLMAPRTVALAVGVLSVPACYPLGRAWGGKLGGLLTAGLMATAAGHVVVNSHVAWTNSATPLFTAPAVWALWRAAAGRERGRAGDRESGRWLAASGLFWGLALQTHPLVLALLAGSGVYVIWRAPGLLRSRWLFAAAGLFLLVNLNLIVYNATTGFGSVAYGQQVSADYNRNQELTPAVYVERAGAVLLGLVQNLGGALESRERDVGVLFDPGVWPVVLLAAVGMVLQWRRGNPLPALLLAGTILVLPLFNGRFAPVLNGRYLAPLLPVLFAGIGPVLVAAWRAVQGWSPERLRRRVVAVALGVLVGFALLHPLLYLARYYDGELRIGRTNAPVFEIVRQIRATRRPDEQVVVDRVLRDRVFGLAEGRTSSVLRLALSANDIPFVMKSLADPDPSDPLDRCREQLVILAARRPEANDRLVADLGLREVGGSLSRSRGAGDPFTLYRMPAASTGCSVGR